MRGLSRARTLATALEIGQFLLETFFEGSIERFRGRERHHVSYRALAARLKGEISASRLYHSVAVLELHRRLPRQVGQALSFSHHKLLLGITDERDLQMMARSCANGSWRCAHLEGKVAEYRQQNPGKRPKTGRTPVHLRVRVYHRLSTVCRQLEEAQGDLVLRDLERHVGRVEVEKLLERLGRCQEELRWALGELDEQSPEEELAG